MPESSTSVHPIETSARNLSYPAYRSYRIRKVADEYSAVESMYRVLDGVHETDRIKLLLHCRDFAWFVRDIESGHVHVASNSCRLRWCPVCAGGRTAYIIDGLNGWFKKRKVARFLTLTLRHSDSDLTTQINHLYESFKKLRLLKQFKKLVSGGIWFFQVKRSKNSEQWHPHLHCVISGKYVPHSLLMKMWLRVTGTSTIVDIKMVRNPEKVSEYVARYASTPVRLKDYSMECRIEIFEALHGRRLAGTWGTARDVSLRPPKYVNDGRYERIGSWTSVNELCRTSEDARKILDAWKQRGPLDPGISCEWADDFINEIPTGYNAEVEILKMNVTSTFW